MAEKFDFEEALKAVQSGQSITGKDGRLGPLVKQLTEAALGRKKARLCVVRVKKKRRIAIPNTVYGLSWQHKIYPFGMLYRHYLALTAATAKEH